MVYLETPTGPRLLNKAVIVWTGHVQSGWPISFSEYVYNDELNGLLTFGNGDEEVQELTWFIPHGAVPINGATTQSALQALEAFKQRYGNRLIVWMNHKDGIPAVSRWAMSDCVVTSAALGYEPFTGDTRAEFMEWAQPLLDKIASAETTIQLLKQL